VKALSHIVLLLWGHGFDEIAASIFVAELRRLGKRVKVVGLSQQPIAGQHGLTLVPDLPLGQALSVANRVNCLIVPAPLAALQQFSYDPRLAELVGLAAKNQALIVVDAPAGHNLYPFACDPPPYSNLNQLVYPPREELFPFVQSVLAPRLS